MRISGTFLDEITHDIPSQNWGRQEWAADFRVMQSIGIDTVIIIRSGYRECAIFESEVLNRHRRMLPVDEDLGAMFLELAAEHDMRLMWGIYDSGDWMTDARAALELNRAFMQEVQGRYGDHPAFAGWYITFELSRQNAEQVALVREAGLHAKTLTPELPTLISPYIAGTKAPDGVKRVGREQHAAEWGAIFAQIQDAIDIVAFQDGHVHFLDLPDYLALNMQLAKEHGIQCWSNVETFDRDMPIKFPPIDWRKLRFKMEAAAQVGVDKLITFEFAHFLSPNATNPAARLLFDRYREYLAR